MQNKMDSLVRVDEAQACIDHATTVITAGVLREIKLVQQLRAARRQNENLNAALTAAQAQIEKMKGSASKNGAAARTGKSNGAEALAS